MGRLGDRSDRPLGYRDGRACCARSSSTGSPSQKAQSADRAPAQTGPNAELTALNRTVDRAFAPRRSRRAAIVLIVIDMIYKPGA